MKSLTPKLLLLVIGAAALLFVSRANAIPINITNSGGLLVGDVSRGDLANNNASTHLAWLAGQVTGYNAITLASLPAPSGGFDASGGIGGSINLTGYSYATLHYGKGPNGIGQGGGVVAYNLNGTTSFTFPNSGLGPNGLGGLSTVYLFGPAPSVPDGASTVSLVGLAFLAAVFLRRAFRSV